MEWGAVFGDEVVATAILDRVLHHSHVLAVWSDRLRLREIQRSGLFKASTAVSTIPSTEEEE
jgi:DNA replication protein DnaC